MLPKTRYVQSLIALAFCSVGMLVFSGGAMAAPCAAASGVTNTIAADCTDVTWSNGSLTINPGVTVTRSTLLGGVLVSGSTVTDLTNSATATIDATVGGTDRGIRANSSTIGTITNAGTIKSTDTSIDLFNTTVTTINNTGTINSTNGLNGINLFSTSTVTTINNITGTILGGSASGGYGGISNSGTITTLNNGQAGLTIMRNAPTNYNVSVSSTSSYGTLTVNNTTGFVISAMNFGIATGSVITNNHTYDNVITTNFGATFDSTATKTGTYTSGGTTYSYQLVWDGSAWDLVVGTPSASSATPADTLTALEQNAKGLASVYNRQTAAMQTAMTYDCTVFDSNNLCVALGGRYSYADASPTANALAGLVMASYRLTPNVRIGGFVDQSVNSSESYRFRTNTSNPMWGLFANWSMNTSGQGLSLQASLVSSDSSITATRAQLTGSEAGSGKTQLRGQGYRLVASYQYPVSANLAVIPYIGLQYTRLGSSAYTEGSSTGVTAPLSFQSAVQKDFAAIAGLGVRSQLADKLVGTAAVGVQQQLNYSMDAYRGTSSISGLSSFSVNLPGKSATLATARGGVAYELGKTERIGLNVLWQQQSFKNTSTTTALATYSIGF